jgi:hypothetical protein
VPGKRVSVRKTREVLRLHFDLKLGAAADRPLPDFARIHDELQQHKHTTRQLRWGSTVPCIPKATHTASSASFTGTGSKGVISSCVRSIVRERSCSSIGPVRRCPLTTRIPAQFILLRCSWRVWRQQLHLR